MLKLYFLLGQKLAYSGGEDILLNILNRLTLLKDAYEISYCYDFTPPSKKEERLPYLKIRRDPLIEYFKQDPEWIIVAMGWMATELISGIGKTKMSQLIGCRFPYPPFKYDTWFTYDPAAAIFDPNLYVDIMACVSAAIRYSGRQVIINRHVNPYQWPGI